jgi:hypothetical protein
MDALTGEAKPCPKNDPEAAGRFWDQTGWTSLSGAVAGDRSSIQALSGHPGARGASEVFSEMASGEFCRGELEAFAARVMRSSLNSIGTRETVDACFSILRTVKNG